MAESIVPDLEIIQTLLKDNPDWRQKVLKRYVKFLNEFINSNYELNLVAERFNYTESDMQSIFYRIELHLKEALDWNPRIHFTDIPFDKRTELIFTLKQAQSVNIDKVFPHKLATIIKSLVKEKNISTVSEILNMEKHRILNRVLGCRRARKPCELGATFYIEQSKSKNAG